MQQGSKPNGTLMETFKIKDKFATNLKEHNCEKRIETDSCQKMPAINQINA